MTQESVNAIGVSIPPTLLARAVKAESPLSRSVFCAPFRVPYRPAPVACHLEMNFKNWLDRLGSGRVWRAVSFSTEDVRHQVCAIKHCRNLRTSCPFGQTLTWPAVLFPKPMRARPIIRRVPGMTWFGHCIVNVTTALRTLPPAGQLMLIRDLRDFLDRQEQEIHRRQRARRPEVTSI
jgi:hypothetical protein